MTDKYRLLARKLPDGTYRCLVLRDPTPDGSLKPIWIGEASNVIDRYSEPFKEGVVTAAEEFRWLHGFDVIAKNLSFITMALNGVVVSSVKRIVLTTSFPGAGTDIGEFEFAESKGGENVRGPKLDLFSSLQELWKSSEGPNEALRDEIFNIVESFCCSQNIEYQTERKEGETKVTIKHFESTDPVGPAALIQLYLDDRELLAIAKSDTDSAGRFGSLALAALSGYVFDASSVPKVPRESTPALRFTFTADETSETEAELQLVPFSDKKTQAHLAFAIDEEPEGLYLRVDWNMVSLEDEDKSALIAWKKWSQNGEFPDAPSLVNDISDHTILVKRSVGPAPVFGSEVLARSPLLVQVGKVEDSHGFINGQPLPKYLFVDRLKPDEFVGKLMHYSIEIRNVVDQPVACGQVSIRRRRLDPPPMPAEAKATLVISKEKENKFGQKLLIEVELPGKLTEKDVIPVVWYQERPLDACGFFGTDDDMALEEGLRQADLNFEEDADTSEPTPPTNPRDWEGHPVSRYLRGAYDRHGLRELKLKTNEWVPTIAEAATTSPAPKPKNTGVADKGEVLTATVEVDRICVLNDSGARLYVALRRREEPSEARFTEHAVVEGVLRPCDHFLSVGNLREQRIFQIEHISFAENQNNLVSRDLISLQYLDAEDNPNPKPNEVWKTSSEVKDWKPEPFGVRVQFSAQSKFSAQNSNVLPGAFRVWIRDVIGSKKPSFELVKTFEALPPEVYRYRPYSIDSAKQLSNRRPFEVPENASDHKVTAIQTGWDFFDLLSVDVRTWPGAPRLVRVSESGNSEKTGKETLEKGFPTLEPGQLDALVGRLKQTGSEYELPWEEEKNDDEEVDEKDAEKGDDPTKGSFSKLFELLKKQVDKPEESQKPWTSPILSSWDLLGPFVDWAHANGMARDLILPLSVRIIEDLREYNSKLENVASRYTEELRKEGENNSIRIVAFAIVPHCWVKTRQTMATIRICVLPPTPDETLDNDYAQLVHLALRYLADKSVLHVYEEDDSDNGLLPFDDTGTCSVDWPGIKDLWRHQLECVIEQFDRYALVRAIANQPEPSPDEDKEPETNKEEGKVVAESKEDGNRVAGLADFSALPSSLSKQPTISSEGEIKDNIQRLVVPRLMLAPPPPVIGGVADIKKVAFRLEESQERQAAAHNLLNRVRSGRITRIVSFDYTLPWLKRFEKFFSLDLRSDQSSDSTINYKDLANFDPGSEATDQDEVEIVNPLFFAKYRLRVRDRADRVDLNEKKIIDSKSEFVSTFSEAESQCHPRIIALKSKKLKWKVRVPKDEANDEPVVERILTIPLVSLGDLISKIEKDEVVKYDIPKHFLKLPDLETRYTILLEINSNPRRMNPLAIVSLPGYETEVMTQDPSTEIIHSPTFATLTISNAKFARGEGRPANPPQYLEVALQGLTSNQAKNIEVLVTRGDLSAVLKENGEG